MSKKKIIIFSGGKFPYGSWPTRTRLWVKGFNYNNIDAEIVVMFPPVPKANHFASDNFVKFMHNPLEGELNSFSFLLKYFSGIYKSFFYLIKQKNIEFVLCTGGNFISTFVFIYYCKIKKIKFKIEIADEIPFDKKQSFLRKIINLNKILFDKYIVKNVDTLFVITSYLENKFRDLHPRLNIIRSSPSIVDINEINQNKYHDLSEMSNELNTVFNSNGIKIIYAGSCARTNGLEFFLKSAKTLIDKRYRFEIIIISYLGDIQNLKNIVGEIGLSNRTHYFENILPKYITTCYNKSDILILPEHGNLIANAGFPSKTGELLAAGKAICATNFSDLSNYLIHNENSMIAEVDDFTTYTINLERLFIDKKLRLKLGINAKVTAEKYFSYNEVVKKYINN